MPTILVVDDEANIRDVVQYALEREGFTVETASDGEAALTRITRGGLDLVVLDVLMPGMNGIEVCRELRRTSTLPVVFLSSRGEEVDRIVGLELGGDDYVTKPFSPRELATRVKTVLRRAQTTTVQHAPANAANKDIIVHGRLMIDVPAHELRVDGQRVDLTVTELALLRALLQQPGHVLTRAQLIDHVRDADTHITERTIDTHVRRVRAKLRPFELDPIETVHGLGYKSAERAC